MEENNVKLKIRNQIQASRKLNVERNMLLNKVQMLKGQVRV
jgi:hypothetical protein